jgi:glycosyltransferase involved in cell wall biosynthesis
MNTVSVIIPVLNGGASFRTCLSSLKAASCAPLEILVIDDGSTDGSAELAAESGAKVLRLPDTGGPARARNRGARAARGELLLFLDADVAVHRDTIARIVAAFDAEPELAALFGSYDDAPAATNFLSQYRNLLHHFVHQDSREEASTFWSGCGAIRRQIFLAMDGFDERYRRPSIEDIELGYRLTRAGHRIRLCKTVLATHLKEWRALSMLKADLLQRAVPWTELILGSGRFINDLNLRSEARASVILAYASLGFLVAAWWWRGLLFFFTLCFLAMLTCNLRLFSFFRRKRGLLFALFTVPWVCLFQFYSGLGFFLGFWRHLFR